MAIHFKRVNSVPKKYVHVNNQIPEEYLHELQRSGTVIVKVGGSVYIPSNDFEDYVNPPQHFVRIEAATAETGYSSRSIKKLVEWNYVEGKRRGGVLFVDREELFGFSLHEDFIPIAEATKLGYSEGYLRHLAERGNIRSIDYEDMHYVSRKDIISHRDPPEGLISAKEAATKMKWPISKIRRLANLGRVSHTRHLSYIYVSLVDLQEYEKPEGFLTLDDAASVYSREYLKRIAISGKIERKTVGRKVLISKASLDAYASPHNRHT